jgi:hypothetical protein
MLSTDILDVRISKPVSLKFVIIDPLKRGAAGLLNIEGQHQRGATTVGPELENFEILRASRTSEIAFF